MVVPNPMSNAIILVQHPISLQIYTSISDKTKKQRTEPQYRWTGQGGQVVIPGVSPGFKLSLKCSYFEQKFYHHYFLHNFQYDTFSCNDFETLFRYDEDGKEDV